MTYQEIKDRLSKCELTLTKLKNGTYDKSNETIAEKVKQLTIIKESLQKQLKEADKGVVYTDDEKKAKELADDGADVKLTDELDEDVKFGVNETKAIARKVGEAVAKALKQLGDEVAHMKAKKIEPNSFEIYVEYKNDNEDQFSFYITDDTLHLTDFSFDKEITDVGVKPSGEAVVNVDVVANELQKHFKSMNEKVNEAPDNMYYIKISKDAASQNKAQVIFNDIYDIDYEINDDPDGIIMYFKKDDYNPGLLDDLEGDMVQVLDTNIPMSEADDKDDYGRPHVDPKGSRTFLEPDEMLPHNRFKKMTQKEDKDIGHQDDEPDMLQSTAFETAQYAAKLVKKLQKYDNFDGEVDFPNWWQSKLILAKDYMQKAYHYLDSEEKQPAIDQLALENLTFKEPKGIDKVAGGIPYTREGNKFIISMSLPDDVKERLLDKAKKNGFQAAPNMSGGVTIMAKEGKKASDGMSTKIKPSEGDPTNMAYTDAVEEMQVTNKKTGEDITTHVISLLKGKIDQKQFEKLTGLKKEGKYKSDAQRKAIYATKAEKENVNEELSDDQRDALEELERILDQAGQLGGEARDIIAQTFPNHLSQGDAYGAFNFGDSSNSYDTTLSSIVQNIYDGDEDIDEGRKDKDALYPDNPRLPEIKNLADKIISMVKAEAAKGELGYIRTMEEIRYLQEDDFERTPEWNKAKGIRADFDDYGSGTNEGRNVDDLYDTTINTMKRLAKKYKAGDKSVVPHLKKLTDIKKKLEQEKIKKAANIGKDQELTEGRGDGEAINDIIINMANEDDISTREAAEEIIDHITHIFINTKGVEEAELDKKERSKLKDIVKQLKKSVKGHGNQAKYIDSLVKEDDKEIAHDCANHVMHLEHGHGICLEGEHTLLEDGTVTHYDVFFKEGSKTVKNIPVNELDIITSSHHGHKRRKKK